MNQNDHSKTIITCNIGTSITSALSQVTAVAKSYIENLFPKDYFKEVYITTSSAFTEQADSNEENDDPKVKQYPQLSINPGFVADMDDNSWGSMPLWRRGIFQRFKENKYYGYRKIFYNDIEDITINVIPNRVKFTFECKIKIDTHFSKMDITNYLRQRLNNNDKFFLNNILLESEIPVTIIKAICGIKNLDITDNDDLAVLRKYLRTYSKGHITYKRNNSTGNNIFSFLYGSNILVNVDSPPESDKNKERINMADDSGIVDFSFNMELWIPNNFFFECKTLPAGDYSPNLINEGKVTFERVVNMHPPEVLGDKVQIGWNKFITEVNVKIDKIDITSMFSKPVLKFIKDRCEANDLTVFDELFDFVIFRDSKPLKRGNDYKINWKTLEVEMILPLFNYVYYIGIYADQDKLIKLVGVENSNNIKTF